MIYRPGDLGALRQSFAVLPWQWNSEQETVNNFGTKM